MSYSLSSNLVPVEWLLAELWPLNLYFCSNLKLSRLFLDLLWYIDLIFGMWLYLDELQFKLEFCSGRMIFGWVMAIELVFFVQILSCPNFIFDVLWYIDLIFGLWLYLDDLQFKFEFRSGRMIFGWVMSLNLYFCLNFKLSGLFLDVLWYIDLIFSIWLYLDELHFMFEFRFGRMIFGWVMTLELVFLFKFEVIQTFSWRPLIYWLDIWYVAISRWVIV